MTVNPPPTIDPLPAMSAAGIAYTTAYALSASVTGEAPLGYRFSYCAVSTGGECEEVFLSTFGSQSNVSTTLPAGNLSLRVYARDGLGSVARASTSFFVVQPFQVVTQAGSCQQLNASIVAARSILASSGAAHTNYMGICDAVRAALSELTRTGDVSRAFTTSLYLQDEFDNIPSPPGGLHTSMCAIPGIVGAPPASSTGVLATSSGCVGASDAVLTFEKLTYALWGVVSEQIASSVVESAEMQDSSFVDQAIQNLLGATQSPIAESSASENATLLTKINNAVEALVAIADPGDLAAANGTGAEGVSTKIAETLSNIITLANQSSADNGASHLPTSACAVTDSAVSLVENLVLRTGEGIAPGQGRQLQTTAFNMSALQVFSDEAFRVAVGEVEAEMPPLDDAGSSGTWGVRPREHIAVGVWSELTARCRSYVSGGASNRETSVVSVTLPGGGRQFPNGTYLNLSIPPGAVNWEAAVTSLGCSEAYSCDFWDTNASTWNNSACEHSVVRGAHICSCKHLTEFAVMRRKRAGQSCDGQTRWDPFYVAFGSAFLLLSAFSAWQLWRLVRAKKLESKVTLSHLLILLQSVFRVISCLLLSDTVKSFRSSDASTGWLLFLLCLPYCIEFWSFSLVVFQYAAMTHNDTLSRTPFKRVKSTYVAINVGVTVLVWVLFGTAVGMGNSDAVLFAGSSAFAAVCLATSVGFLYYGNKISKSFSQSSTSKGKQKGGVDMLWTSSKRVGIAFAVQSIAWVASAAVAARTDDTASIYVLTALNLLAHILACCVLLKLYGGAVRAAEDMSRGSTSGSRKHSGRTTGRSSAENKSRAAKRAGSTAARAIAAARARGQSSEGSRGFGNSSSGDWSYGAARTHERKGTTFTTKTDATVGTPRITKVDSNTTAFSSVLGTSTRVGRVESGATVGSLGTRASGLSLSHSSKSGNTMSRLAHSNGSASRAAVQISGSHSGSSGIEMNLLGQTVSSDVASASDARRGEKKGRYMI